MRRQRQRGFSLIEVLVAFAILALAVSVILSLLATGLRNTGVAGEYGVALALAESKMAELQGMDTARLQPQSSEGLFDGRYQWRSEVRHRDDMASGVAGVAMYGLAVQVRWGEAARVRVIDLSTLRVGRVP